MFFQEKAAIAGGGQSGLGIEELHDKLVLLSDIFPFLSFYFLNTGDVCLDPLAHQALVSVKASLGFALEAPFPILFTLFHFRVLLVENLESKLWALCPCLGLLIKCIGSF